MRTGYVLARDRDEAEYRADDLRTKAQIKKLKSGCGPDWKIYKLKITAEVMKDDQ